MNQNNMVTVNDINKSYTKTEKNAPVLEGISFTVEEGEFIAMMGPSGAGKSTLLHILATIDLPDSGSVSVAGRELTKLGDQELADFRRDELGFIFQEYHLIKTMTAEENIALPLAMEKMSREERKERVREIARQFGIEEILDSLPDQLSGGEKQRVAAARALIMNPSLVLADEPTGALDFHTGEGFLSCLSKRNQEQKTTIMMVTHDPVAASYANRILLLKDGKLAGEMNRVTEDRKLFLQEILRMQAESLSDNRQ